MMADAVAAVCAMFWLLMFDKPAVASILSTKAAALPLVMRPAELAMRPAVKALR